MPEPARPDKPPPDPAPRAQRTWFTTAQASALLGITERAVQLRARRGKIEHKRERSPETGRMRLLVTGPELVKLAAQGPPGPTLVRGRNFIPRFHDLPPEEDSVGPEEFDAITEHLEELDRGHLHARSRELAAERDRLTRSLAEEREQSQAQERHLHRYIDRQEERHRQREGRLQGQLAEVARALGRVEHRVLELERRPPWWRRLARALWPFLRAHPVAEGETRPRGKVRTRRGRRGGR